MRRGPLTSSAAICVLVTLAAACSDSGEGARPTAETFQTVAVSEPLFTRTTDDAVVDGTGPIVGGGAPSSTSSPSSVTDPTATTGATAATTVATVPDTGVPGIDSNEPFCRAWSRFAGSFQALAAAWAFDDSANAARLEVAAAPVVVAAAESLAADLPADLERERDALAAYTEPMVRRASSAIEELTAGGLSGDDVDRLGEEWLDSLAAAGVDQSTLQVDVPVGVDGSAFVGAVDAFAAARPSIVEDPSMITDVQIPATDEYIAANCPDQGTLGGNDVIGGP